MLYSVGVSTCHSPRYSCCRSNSYQFFGCYISHNIMLHSCLVRIETAHHVYNSLTAIIGIGCMLDVYVYENMENAHEPRLCV